MRCGVFYFQQFHKDEIQILSKWLNASLESIQPTTYPTHVSNMIINGEKPKEGFKVGSKRVGLARTQALIEGLKRELQMNGASFAGTKFLAGDIATTATAAASATQLTEALIVRVDSANNAHKVKMFEASAVGQLCVVVNVDDGQDAVVRNADDDATLITLGEGKGCLFVSTAVGDNWLLAITGA